MMLLRLLALVRRAPFSVLLLLAWVGAGTIAWWMYTSAVTTTVTGVNVRRIEERRDLVSLVYHYDFFVDFREEKGGEYTAILPVTVRAGVDLRAVRATPAEAKHTEAASVVEIQVPGARILSTDVGQSGTVISGSTRRDRLVTAFKTFAERRARQYAIREGILSEAATAARPALERLHPQHDAIRFVEASPANAPSGPALAHDVPNRYNPYRIEANDLERVWTPAEPVATPETGRPFVLRSDRGDEVRIVHCEQGDLLSLDDSEAYTRFLDLLRPRWRIYMGTVGANRMELRFGQNRQIFCATIESADESAFIDALPDGLLIVQGIEMGPARHVPYGERDITGKRFFFRDLMRARLARHEVEPFPGRQIAVLVPENVKKAEQLGSIREHLRECLGALRKTENHLVAALYTGEDDDILVLVFPTTLGFVEGAGQDAPAVEVPFRELWEQGRLRFEKSLFKGDPILTIYPGSGWKDLDGEMARILFEERDRADGFFRTAAAETRWSDP